MPFNLSSASPWWFSGTASAHSGQSVSSAGIATPHAVHSEKLFSVGFSLGTADRLAAVPLFKQVHFSLHDAAEFGNIFGH